MRYAILVPEYSESAYFGRGVPREIDSVHVEWDIHAFFTRKGNTPAIRLWGFCGSYC